MIGFMAVAAAVSLALIGRSVRVRERQSEESGGRGVTGGPHGIPGGSRAVRPQKVSERGGSGGDQGTGITKWMVSDRQGPTAI